MDLDRVAERCKFITFAVIGITLFTPMEDAAYAMARAFTTGLVLTAILAAVVDFALLPQLTTFRDFVLHSAWCWCQLGHWRRNLGSKLFL